MAKGVQFKVSTKGFDLAKNLLRDIAYRGGHLKSPFEKSGKYLIEQTHENFEREQSPNHQAWQPLAPSTAASRGSDHPILQLSGDLRSSIKYVATDKGLSVGSNLIYARIHQYGGDAGRGHASHIPARPYLGVNREHMDYIHDLFLEYLVEKL